MEWKREWNVTEISVWNMEDARMEWNGMEDFKNGMEDSVAIPYLILCIVFTEKYIPMSGSDKNIFTEVFNFNICAYYLSTYRGTLVVYIAQTVYVLHHCKYIAI